MAVELGDLVLSEAAMHLARVQAVHVAGAEPPVTAGEASVVRVVSTVGRFVG